MAYAKDIRTVQMTWFLLLSAATVIQNARHIYLSDNVFISSFLEISLKHIYQRCYGELPEGGHDLLTLWFTVKRDVIDKFIISEEFVESVKARKENFTLYSLDGISLSKIQLLLRNCRKPIKHPPNQILKPNRLIKKPRFGGI